VTDEIDDVNVINAESHGDHRGRLVEVLHASDSSVRFVQANHSHSVRHVLRGLHYHRRQTDWWYLVSGSARVALADLRRKVERPPVQMIELRSDEPTVLQIPAGVAHGFLALSDIDLIYLVSEEYDGTDEFGIAWNDPSLAIPWGIDRPILSARDRDNPELQWERIPQFS
jgi:dTDP-4-dehydrorhamnose 3,5-epimerase